MTGLGEIATVLPLPLSVAYGGREIQALRSIEALRSLGVAIRPLDPWDPAQTYRAVHCFGTDGGLWELASRARATGTKVIVSPILVFGRSVSAFRAWAHVDRLVPMRTSFRYRRDLLGLADAVIALTMTERRVLETVYGVASARCHVIPNGVDPAFREARAEHYREQWGADRFILSVGSIEARKGQLAVLHAAQRAAKPVVFVGDVRRDDRYGAAFEEAVGGATQVVWHRHLDAGSELLASAYAAADALVLPSAAEGMPLVALEARAAGCPLIMSDLPQHIEAFPGATFVRVGDDVALTRAIEGVNPRRDAREAAPLSWIEVAEKILRVYEAVLPGIGAPE